MLRVVVVVSVPLFLLSFFSFQLNIASSARSRTRIDWVVDIDGQVSDRIDE
jgi:hypothetical protein